MVKPLKCPRCELIQKKIGINCNECNLPLSPHKLSQYAENLKYQWERFEDEDFLQYENGKVRIYSKEFAKKYPQTERIVYHRNRRYILLDFTTILDGKKPIIHYKIRPEKGLILHYPTKHKLCKIIFGALENLSQQLNWILIDIRERLDHDLELEKKVEERTH